MSDIVNKNSTPTDILVAANKLYDSIAILVLIPILEEDREKRVHKAKTGAWVSAFVWVEYDDTN